MNVHMRARTQERTPIVITQDLPGRHQWSNIDRDGAAAGSSSNSVAGVEGVDPQSCSTALVLVLTRRDGGLSP